MAALESFFTESDNAPDREVEQADWERLAEEAVTATRSVYPRTKPEQLREDLALLMESLIAIARGQEPPVEVGTLSLGDYAPYMSAPHRMDLMVSAMMKDGAWHCNQKCLHCYAAGQPMGESQELTTAQWKEAALWRSYPPTCGISRASERHGPRLWRSWASPPCVTSSAISPAPTRIGP